MATIKPKRVRTEKVILITQQARDDLQHIMSALPPVGQKRVSAEVFRVVRRAVESYQAQGKTPAQIWDLLFPPAKPNGSQPANGGK